MRHEARGTKGGSTREESYVRAWLALFGRREKERDIKGTSTVVHYGGVGLAGDWQWTPSGPVDP